MPLSWPWKKPVSDPTLRSAWDYEFHITPLHMTIEERDRLKQSYDSLADKAYAILASLSADRKSKQQVVSTVSSESLVQDKIPTTESIPDTPSASIAQNSNPRPKRDLYALLRDNFSTDPILEELWIQANEVPEWVDWNQISRGQEVFYRYGAPALMGLAFQSLLGGMGSGRVVEVCHSSHMWIVI